MWSILYACTEDRLLNASQLYFFVAHGYSEWVVLSVARFCHVFPCELQGPAWAVGRYSISQSAGGTSQNIIFKTLRQIGRPALYSTPQRGTRSWRGRNRWRRRWRFRRRSGGWCRRCRPTPDSCSWSRSTSSGLNKRGVQAVSHRNGFWAEYSCRNLAEYSVKTVLVKIMGFGDERNIR